MTEKRNYRYPTITMTDQDEQYRDMIEEIAFWIHNKNPFDYKPGQRRKFNLKTRRGEVMKLAIDDLYQKMMDNIHE